MATPRLVQLWSSFCFAPYVVTVGPFSGALFFTEISLPCQLYLNFVGGCKRYLSLATRERWRVGQRSCRRFPDSDRRIGWSRMADAVPFRYRSDVIYRRDSLVALALGARCSSSFGFTAATRCLFVAGAAFRYPPLGGLAFSIPACFFTPCNDTCVYNAHHDAT